MVDERLEVLLEAHQKIGIEIGQGRSLGGEGEWKEGHINGLKEANLRVEQVMYDIIEEKELAEAYQEASCRCHE